MTTIDLAGVLGALVRHDVEFVVSGGVAVIAHGGRRVPLDVDVLVGTEPANIEKLTAATAELGAIGLGRLNVLTDAPGSPGFAELRRRAVGVKAGDLSFSVVSRDHLIAMKLAAGRPRDLQDVADLNVGETE